MATEQLLGWLASGTGSSRVGLRLDDDAAEVHVQARWMGQAELDVVLACTHQIVGSHSGVLRVSSARVGGAGTPLPPSDGPVLIEYVRVPPQPAVRSSTLLDVSADVTDPYTLVLWLHPQSYFDDGTQLPLDDYEVPPDQWKPVVDALKAIEYPCKLGPRDPET